MNLPAVDLPYRKITAMKRFPRSVLTSCRPSSQPASQPVLYGSIQYVPPVSLSVQRELAGTTKRWCPSINTEYRNLGGKNTERTNDLRLTYYYLLRTYYYLSGLFSTTPCLLLYFTSTLRYVCTSPAAAAAAAPLLLRLHLSRIFSPRFDLLDLSIFRELTFLLSRRGGLDYQSVPPVFARNFPNRFAHSLS